MKTLPKFIRLPPEDCANREVTLVHAGCLPDVPLEQQDDFMLMHIGNIMPRNIGGRNEHGHVEHGYWPPLVQTWWTSKAPKDSFYWASRYDGSLGLVVFGHTGVDKPEWFNYALALDTGCCFGRSLSALILPDWRLVSVPSSVSVPDRKRKRYEVHPGIFIHG